MHVEVEDGHTPDAVDGLCVRDANEDIVVQAKAHRLRRLGMMTRRASHDESTTHARGVGTEDGVDGGDDETSCAARGRWRAATDDRVRVQVDRQLPPLHLREGLLDELDVLSRVHPQQLLLGHIGLERILDDERTIVIAKAPRSTAHGAQQPREPIDTLWVQVGLAIRKFALAARVVAEADVARVEHDGGQSSEHCEPISRQNTRAATCVARWKPCLAC